jgi:curli biogenesis system outer membrane secretion channel CsgG
MLLLRAAFSCSILAALLSGCGPTAEVIHKGGPTIAQAEAEPASGDKMRITVMGFENQTAFDVGNGMRAMLTSALFRTGKFIVIERQELSDVLLEQKLGASGVVSEATAAPVGEVEGAQVLIYGTVTDFLPGQRGIISTMGSAEQSHVAIDLKLVDSRTTRILATATVEGKATDVTLDTSALRYVGMSPLYSLSVWNNTPVGSAIRLCIDRAVGFIVEQLH